MNFVTRYLKIIAITLLLGFCGVRLWDAALAYTGENRTKNEMQEYISRRPAGRSAGGQYSADAQQPPAEPELQSSYQTTKAAYAPAVEHTEALPLPDDTGGIPAVNSFIEDLQDEVNNKISAWLSIPGANIDYPVISADDNEHYLRRDVYGNESQAGSLFTDSRCARQYSGLNTIIYGHNMKNRSMFGNLQLYADASYFDENRQGYLYTSAKTFALQIFAYMILPSDDPEVYANPSNIGDLHEYIKNKARIYREPVHYGRVITLSTCSYEYDNARIAVFAVLVNGDYGEE